MLTIPELYWGGFLAADGNVDDLNRVRLGLHYKDVAHVAKFKAFTGKPNIIQHTEAYPDRCTFEFTDSKMVRYLRDNFNIVPNKSLIYTIPDSITEEQFPHFVRGIFDGDGCICESFSNVNSKMATLYTTFVGSTDSMQQIYDRLQKYIGITGYLQSRKKYSSTGSEFSMIKYSTNKSKVLLDYLYSKSTEETRLDRKYALYHNIIVLGNRLMR